MLNFGPEKMLVIMFIAMLVLGPEKLPEMARKMGKVMGDLRRVSGGFQDELRRAIDDTTGASGLREIKQELTDTARQAAGLDSTTSPAAGGNAPATDPAPAADAAPAAPDAGATEAPAAGER